jgi:hypothetical protein
MLMALLVLLLGLWFLGVISAYTFGGFIHVLLLFAMVVVLLRIIQSPEPER